jgi:flagellar hook-associated protein FlgK
VLRHDASLSAIIEQLSGMTVQFNRFDMRLRRLEEEPTA